jgi:WD40 repeat protein
MAARLVDERDDRELLFVSYSHTDDVWAQRFEVLLKPLVRRRRLRLWVDRTIRVGDRWRPEIEQAIARSRMALLLVSADYLASDFILDDELPALGRHRVRLAPVLVGDCLWQEVPELAVVQWLHYPGRDGALALHGDDAGQRDRRIRLACERLLELTPNSAGIGPPARGGSVSAAAVVERVTDGLVRGRMSQVPALPPGYVAREELAAVIELVVGGQGGGAVGLTGQPAGVGLYGMGGIGKSVMAAALARDDRTARRFPDGVFWVTVGEHPDLLGLQLDLLARLGVAGDTALPRTVAEATGRLQHAMTDRQVLLVVDDVWSDAAALAFRVTGPRGRLLYTSRDEQVITAVRSAAHRIGVLSRDTARALAAGILGEQAAALPAAADGAFAQVGWVPLAVALVSAAVRGGQTWEQVCTHLDNDTDVFGDHPYANTFRAISLSAAVLPLELREALLSLAVFPADAAIPTAAVIRYWTHSRGRTPRQVRTDLDQLASANLLHYDGATIGFHDLQHDYLLLHAPAPAILHAELLTAYRRVRPDAIDRWSRLPAEEPYIWDHLIEHLSRAGDRRTLATTVTDPAYQAQRITGGGTYAGEADLALAAQTLPDDQLVTWWLDWLGRHAHLLGRRRTEENRQRRGACIAATMMAWLYADPHRPAAIRADDLAGLLSRPYPAVLDGLTPLTGGLMRVLAGHVAEVDAVAWSPDGIWLASAGLDLTVRIWDPSTGQTTTILTGHTDSVQALAWSPDGTQLATAGLDQTVRIWDPPTGQTTTILTGHTDSVQALAWSPDGTQLATAGLDQTVRIWDPATRQRTTFVHADSVRALAWSPDGTRLASAGANLAVRIRHVATGQTTTLTGHTDSVRALAWSPDSTRLASASADQTVRIWHPHTGQTMAVLTGHTDWANTVAWSPDGTHLATGSDDQTVRIWDPTTEQTTVTLTGHTDWVQAVAWSPDGTRLATAAHDLTVRIWDPTISQTATSILAGEIAGVRAVAWSPDGARLASAGTDQKVRIWERADAQTTILTGHTDWVRAVAWSPDGAQLASASADSTVRIWDPTTGQTVLCIASHTAGARTAAWSPDGAQLATGSDDQTVRTWTRATGQTTILAGHTAAVYAVAWSPDGTRVATTSADGTARLWNPTTGQTITTLSGHTGEVNALAWSPDGTRIVTGGDDQTVRVWNPVTGQTTTTLTGHAGWVRAIAWSPDGAHLATADQHGLVIIWSQAGEEITSIALQTVYSLTWVHDMIAIAQGGLPAIVKITDSGSA